MNMILNETLNVLFNRKSLRNYDQKVISEAEINLIIKAAMRAPTAGNMMLYTILQVTDQEKKEKLVKTCDNQPFIAKAPLVLIFLADLQRWYDYFAFCKIDRKWCKEQSLDYNTPQEAHFLMACCDALIAAQNAVIAAESLGIGSCYIGDIMENIETHREMFALPKWVFPIAMVCFGYPKAPSDSPVTSRYPQKYIHCVNQYKHLQSADYTSFFADSRVENALKNRTDVKNIGQLVYKSKMGDKFFKEMIRSVKQALNDWNTDQTK